MIFSKVKKIRIPEIIDMLYATYVLLCNAYRSYLYCVMIKIQILQINNYCIKKISNILGNNPIQA
jgi:hypothetical protein